MSSTRTLRNQTLKYHWYDRRVRGRAQCHPESCNHPRREKSSRQGRFGESVRAKVCVVYSRDTTSRRCDRRRESRSFSKPYPVERSRNQTCCSNRSSTRDTLAFSRAHPGYTPISRRLLVYPIALRPRTKTKVRRCFGTTFPRVRSPRSFPCGINCSLLTVCVDARREGTLSAPRRTRRKAVMMMMFANKHLHRDVARSDDRLRRRKGTRSRCNTAKRGTTRRLRGDSHSSHDANPLSRAPSCLMKSTHQACQS